MGSPGAFLGLRFSGPGKGRESLRPGFRPSPPLHATLPCSLLPLSCSGCLVLSVSPSLKSSMELPTFNDLIRNSLSCICKEPLCPTHVPTPWTGPARRVPCVCPRTGWPSSLYLCFLKTFLSCFSPKNEKIHFFFFEVPKPLCTVLK